MSAVIKTAIKPMPAADTPCYQQQTRPYAPFAYTKPKQVAQRHLRLYMASTAMMLGLVLLAITGTAQAQNADLNTNADTVSGINAIPTNLPGSARTITGQPAPPAEPVNLLELAKRHRQAEQSRTDTTAGQAKESDFRLSNQYRNKTASPPRNTNVKRPAQNPDVIQASIMTSENNGANPSDWTKTRDVQGRTQTAPQGNLTAPGITKPGVTPPTSPNVPRAQIVTPWGQTSQQADDNGSTAPLDAASSTSAAAPRMRRNGNPLFAPPQPSPNTAPTTSLPDAGATGHNASPRAPAPTRQQSAPGPMPQKAAQQQPVAPRPTPAAINSAAVPATTADGDYAVQLGAFRSAIGAETYWASFAVRYANLAKTYHHYLGTVNVAGKGQLHRLRMGGFASLEAAKEKCRQLQADGIDCIGLPK